MSGYAPDPQHSEVLLVGRRLVPRTARAPQDLVALVTHHIDEEEFAPLMGLVQVADCLVSSRLVSRGRVFWNLFEQGLHANPDGLAFQTATDSLTYGEMRSRVDELVRSIDVTETDAGLTFAIVLPKVAGLYIAYLAAAFLDATIIPLDVDAPLSRLRQRLRNGGADVVATTPDLASKFDWLPTLILSDAGEWQATTPVIARPSSTQDAAYLMFTSGSTGAPKGVPVTAGSVRSYFEGLRSIYPAGCESRHSQLFTVSFDLSVHDLFVPWSTGGCVCLPSGRAGAALSSYVHGKAITHLFTVPSSLDLALRVNSLAPSSMPDLEIAAFCGEPLTLRHAKAIRAAAPNARLLNLYGPTENTIACTYYELEGDESAWPQTANGSVPIGRPFGETMARITNYEGTEGAGELLLSGPQTFSGYLDSRQNEDAFETESVGSGNRWYRSGDLVSVSASGYVHHGRIDDQLKVRGYRVEPGEVEHALEQLPAIAQAVVVPVSGSSLGLELGAVYVGEVCDHAALRRWLAGHLPTYMIPSHYLRVSELPVNANGKTSRRASRELIEHELGPR